MKEEKEPIVEENRENTTGDNNHPPKIEKLDINNELVQKLYQSVLKYSDYEETLVYQSQAVTIETLPNLLKLRTVFENLTSSEADEVTHKTEYGLDITHTLLKKETVEKKAQKILGDTVTLIHESCPIYFAQAIDYKDGIYDCYSYQGGGQTPEEKLGSKIQTFKHTFKKNANGTYYWYRTEPIK